MAIKVTLETKLKRGDIVRIWGKVVLGIVVRHEIFLKKPGFYAFNNGPGDRKFIRENGVDWYNRRHIEDLVHDKAEIITRDELLSIYEQKPSTELKILLDMIKRRKSSR